MQTPAALNAAFAAGDTASVLAESLAMDGARSILDIGCGRGALARALIKRGFAVAGIDVTEALLDEARDAAPEATFTVGVAEDLPFEPRSFDAAVFLNSLHHVPVARMADALDEARRVVKAKGTLLVVEPLPEGSFFEAMRPVEDETEIRDAAGRAVADAVRDGRFSLAGNVVYERTERFPDLDAFVRRVVSVNPARQATADGNRSEIAARFDALSEEADGLRLLRQPLRVYWLRSQP